MPLDRSCEDLYDDEAVLPPAARAPPRGAALVIFVHQPGHRKAELLGKCGPVCGGAEGDLAVDSERGELLPGGCGTGGCCTA